MTSTSLENGVVSPALDNNDGLFAKALTMGMLLHTRKIFPENFGQASDLLGNEAADSDIMNPDDEAVQQRVVKLALATGVILKATGQYDEKFVEAANLLNNVAEVGKIIHIEMGGIMLMLGMSDLGYEPVIGEKNYRGFKRGQRLLAKSYPMGNTQTWNQTYKKLALLCGSTLYKDNTASSLTAYREQNLHRLSMWLAGEPFETIARNTSSNLGALHVWESNLPSRFRKKVSYSELVHTTDSLYWAINSEGLDSIPRF